MIRHFKPSYSPLSSHHHLAKVRSNYFSGHFCTIFCSKANTISFNHGFNYFVSIFLLDNLFILYMNINDYRAKQVFFYEINDSKRWKNINKSVCREQKNYFNHIWGQTTNYKYDDNKNMRQFSKLNNISKLIKREFYFKYFRLVWNFLLPSMWFMLTELQTFLKFCIKRPSWR